MQQFDTSACDVQKLDESGFADTIDAYAASSINCACIDLEFRSCSTQETLGFTKGNLT